MIGWRETLWFRGVTLLVVALLAGGFVRVLLGFALEAAEANRGAAVAAGAVLFGFGVRASLRRLRNEPKPVRHLRLLEDDPEDPYDPHLFEEPGSD